MNVLHVAIEFNAKVGGLGAVTMGLLPELSKKGVNTYIVTPFFSAYRAVYPDFKLVATVKHIYKSQLHTTNVYAQHVIDPEGGIVTHYLLSPPEDSAWNRLFDIEDATKLYVPFDHSDPWNRREYFNSAVASLVRLNLPDVPKMDIIHLHTWHAALSGCLIKEFTNLNNYSSMLPEGTTVHPVPHVYFTTHMLLEREHGYLRKKLEIQKLIESLGLPRDFARSFPHFQAHIREDHFRMHALGLLYADHVSLVSKSVIAEIFNGVAHGFLDLFTKLREENRLEGITNGVPSKEWDATTKENLGDYALDLQDVLAGKQKIKAYLAQNFTKLDASKPWFLFVGRFANEKGIDLLPTALEAIRSVGGQFIVMGVHISKDRNNPVSRVIESFYDQTDVLVIEDPEIQKVYGKLVRAGSQFTVITSNNETCGLVPRENQLAGSLTIAAKVQGLPDSVIPFTAHYSVGTGFLFDYDPALREDYLLKEVDQSTPERVQLRANLQSVIRSAYETYTALLEKGMLNQVLARVITDARNFDWGATPVSAYVQSYNATLREPVLTYDQIRNTPGRTLLIQYNATKLPVKVVPRVFQIGFNKCGTWSIHDYFERHGITSAHYAPIMVSEMYTNLKKSKPMIPDRFKDLVAFFDLENIYDSRMPLYIAFFFKELDQQYPGSKFILNTRDREKWIKSRLGHSDENNGKSYAEYLCGRYGLTEDQLVAKWRKEWDEHHAAVREYFKDRANDLLVLDIEANTIDAQAQVLSKFIKDQLGIETDPKLYRHLNKNPALKAEGSTAQLLI